MTDWLFQCNPKYYRLSDRFADPDSVITWKVSQYWRQISAGDLAFVWCSRPEPGLRGVLLIDTDPHERDELPHELAYYTNKALARRERRVLATIVERFPLIPEEIVNVTEGLENLPVFAFRNATNFKLTEDQATALHRLVDLQIATRDQT